MNAVQHLIARVLGDEYVSRFEFVITECEVGNDYFKLTSVIDKIRVEASSTLAASSGVYWYMKHYLGIHTSWCGNQLALPEVWPSIEGEVVKETPYTYKYYFNYCTYGYSMAFWEWERWEQELDWMAMNGVNLVLSLVGHEEVWRQTLIEFGYTNEEAKAFICGPAFTPWQWMQNIEGWGSHYRDDWFDRRVALAKKIHKRMEELGIKPAMQGYSGMIPRNFKEKYSEADTREQGMWNALDRPDLLMPGTPLFNQVADVFYIKQKEIFGVETPFYCTDPFHEGGNKEGVDIGECIRVIQGKMIEHDKDAVWIIQAWCGNPDDQTLQALDPKHTIILDLWCEANPTWSKRKAFAGIPWIWCILGNFGGKNGLYGNLEQTANAHREAINSSDSGKMMGIGMTMEGIDNNPVVWDLLCDSSWEQNPIQLEKWLEAYAVRRYGQKDTHVNEAWVVLKDSIYNCTVKQEGGAESIVCARPNLGINSVSTWGPKSTYYDREEVVKACKLFVKGYEQLNLSNAYLYDLVDITRQALADLSRVYYEDMVRCFRANKQAEFKKVSQTFLELIKDTDVLLGTHSGFLLGNYLKQAGELGCTPEEKAYLEWNARTIITLWANEEGSVKLRDYSHRQWAGLIGGLYYTRWEKYIEELQNTLIEQREIMSIDWYEIEHEWTMGQEKYPTEPKGEVQEIVLEIIRKYLS